MDAHQIVSLFFLLPFAGFLISLVIPERGETALSKLAAYALSMHLMALLAFLIFWAFEGFAPFNLKELSLFKSEGFEFVIDFYFDSITAVYLSVGAILTYLIIRYSKYYLHLETGYKRFFNTILLFFSGYNLTVLAGNFETLFIGWEILGLSSFLLIAFYRERYLPVRNAVKVFSVYRLGDVGILMAMWASHHLWHENITFAKLANAELVHDHLAGHTGMGVFIAVCLLVAAMVKSAQFPFSFWLPRAMEGPTPSSAIFYGSLSVHFGVFLLLRTFPFWAEQVSVRWLIGAVGAVTALVGMSIARIQSTIKTQIAYASIGQLGLMFIEIALGLQTLALIHFAGNAFLRTYQLLISPSVVAYMIRDKFYRLEPRKSNVESAMPGRLSATMYVLAMREWYMEWLMTQYFFRPLKHIGQWLDFVKPRNMFLVFGGLYGVGLWLYFTEFYLPFGLRNHLPELFSFFGLMLTMKAFSERKYPRVAWMAVLFNQFWVALAISFNEHFDYSHVLMYLSGSVPAGILGYICLEWLRKKEHKYFGLQSYYGHIYEYRLLGFVFLFATLCLMGFPLSFSFIGEDLIFSHIHDNQYLLAFLNALSFIIGGIALIRMYARLFLGPHAKPYHEVGLPSS